MARTAAEKAEIIRCGKDPIYFIKTYVKIQHTTKGLIPFNLFPYQESIVDSLERYRKTLILKSRQLGLTETVSQYVLWLCLFHRDKIVIVFSKDKAAAGEFIRRIKIAYDNLPRFLKIASLPRDNVYSIGFSNRSMIECFGRTDNAGAGRSASLIVIDEAALIRNVESLWTAVKPTISASNGKAVVMSTPRGVGNWFETMCATAKKEAEQEARGEGVIPDWRFFEFPWTVWPGHDEAWFREETRDLTPMQIAQEYSCSFLASGENLLTTEALRALLDSTLGPIHREHNNKLWWWEEIDGDMEYVVAVDPSRGDSSDYGAIQVVCKDTGAQVAEYYDRISPNRLAEITLEVAKKCNDAFIIVDGTGGYGSVLLNYFESQGYRNIYFWEKSTANAWRQYDIISRKQLNYSNTSANGAVNTRFVPGWWWTSKNRPVVINNMETVIRKEQVKLRSMRLYEEFLRFKWIDGKAQAEHGAHDDLVMSLALALWCTSKISEVESIKQQSIKSINTVFKQSNENEEMKTQFDKAKRDSLLPGYSSYRYRAGDKRYIRALSGLMR